MVLPTAPPTNGQVPVPEKDRVEDLLLGEPFTQGYRPTLPLWAMFTTDVAPQLYLLRDVELMMIHPVCLNALNYFKAGISGAEFEVESDNPAADLFIMDQCVRYWDRGVPKIQAGYEYGWIGCENMFSDRDGPLMWDDLIHFSPRDCFLLTQDTRPVGVRVKNIYSQPQLQDDAIHDIARRQSGFAKPVGVADLWTATDTIPAKGLWYAHNPRYSQWYGQSQFLGAWKPWRRLAWKDGAETVIDGGVYRYAYAGMQVDYPEEDYAVPIGTSVPATTLDSQGRPRRFARDIARQIAEQAKTGAACGVPTTKYPPELGGGDKWKITWPKNVLNVSSLIEYIKYLIGQIREGIGVPGELFEAGETGSGYSGRAIPLEGFLMLQQRLADALLKLFVEQVLRQLVLWNFGPVKWKVKVKPLLESKRKIQMGQQAQPGESPMETPQPARPPGSPPPNQTQQGLMPPPPPVPPSPTGNYGFSLAPQLITDKMRELARRIRRAA